MKHLLTDFNKQIWEDYNLENVPSEIEKLNKKVEEYGVYGELITEERNNGIDFSLKNASHTISNITYENKKIYGEIRFFKTKLSKKAKQMVDENNYRIDIRAAAVGTVIKHIFTWDIKYPQIR